MPQSASVDVRKMITDASDAAGFGAGTTFCVNIKIDLHDDGSAEVKEVLFNRIFDDEGYTIYSSETAYYSRKISSHEWNAAYAFVKKAATSLWAAMVNEALASEGSSDVY